MGPQWKFWNIPMDDFTTAYDLKMERLRRFEELESAFELWLSKQPLPVEAALEAAMNAVGGAALGLFLLHDDPYALCPPHVMASLKLKPVQPLPGDLRIQAARNFAVFAGLNSGISCVMKRLRGKEDVESMSDMVAAFVSGAAFGLVSDLSSSRWAANAAASGLIFALGMGGHFQLGQMLSRLPSNETVYSKARSMLSNLGLQIYEKNFKKGLLTDSALRDAKIPILVLDQIQNVLPFREASRADEQSPTQPRTHPSTAPVLACPKP